MDIRPRTTGEIFDDAWRFYRADAPLLLALCARGLLPACLGIIVLLVLPRPDGIIERLGLAALVTAAILFSGMAPATCQEVFRARAEGKAIGPGILWPIPLLNLWRRLDHLAARALVWSLTLLGSAFLVLPAWFIGAAIVAGLTPEGGARVVLTYIFVFAMSFLVSGVAALAGGLAIHPILAVGERHCFGAWVEALRETQRQAGKAAAVALSRPFLWLFVVINLHILVRIGLWVGDELAGFDLAVASLALSAENYVYVTILVLLAGLLLAPLHEAVTYLLHVDARARYEGLDLWYRVRRAFPAADKSLAGALLMAAAIGLLAPGPVCAADDVREAVQAARKEVARIAKQVTESDDFQPNRWLPRLQAVAQQLNAAAEDRPGNYRWFERSLTGWAKADRAKALAILDSLERRLALAEEAFEAVDEPALGPAKSKEEIKALLPPDPGSDPGRAKDAKEKREQKQRVRRDDFGDDGPARRSGGASGVVPPNPLGGFGTIGWSLLGGLLVIVVVIAAILALRQKTPQAPKTAAAKPAELSLEALLAQTQRPVGEGLWRQADDLAGAGRWLEALRTLYVAVLALLHRADLIRYSDTRTNGEYLAQVRPRTEVYLPFESLTDCFELKWYGEKTCRPEDYQTCRQLAEQVRGEIKA